MKRGREPLISRLFLFPVIFPSGYGPYDPAVPLDRYARFPSNGFTLMKIGVLWYVCTDDI
jgi:hypothetical protein